MGDENVWNLCVTNYGEREYLDLTREQARRVIEEEWSREFSGIIIGPDIECRGQFLVFFRGDSAYVAYDDLIKKEWRCSYDLEACERRDWNELVGLTPDDTEDRCFRKCSVIAKDHAWRIVEAFMESGDLPGLYVSGPTGKPVLTNSGPNVSLK